MLLAVSLVLSSIALGAILGLLPGSSPHAASPFRTFAMVTSVAVVLGQLLPEALSAVGIAAFAAFGAGFAAPRLAERLAIKLRKPACTHDDAMCTDLGLEVGYVGLVLHHIGDGIGIGLYSGPQHAGHEHFDVLAALAGHTIPITALLVLAFKTHRGPLSAAWRALGIAASTLVGVLLASLITPEHLAVWEPWLTAAVGGLLLHIVTHGWPEEAAATPVSRMMDFAAIAAGLGIVALGGHSHAHEHGHPDLRGAMGSSLLELGLETAPMLLIGLCIAALVQTQGARIPARWLQGGGRFAQAVRGALIGVPLPVCACGILPVAHSLRQRGGAAALVVAFLLATPELGVDSLALTVRFLGWPFAIVRLVGAFVVATAAGVVVARFSPPTPSHRHDHELSPHHDHAHEPEDAPFAAEAGRSLVGQVGENFHELIYHIGAWTLVGLLAAAYLQVGLTEDGLHHFAGSGLDILVVTALAVPSYVCASSATPLAAVLLSKGISPGAVLCGLLLGPATNIATLAWLRKAYGGRAALFGMVSILATTWSLAWLVNRWLPPVPPGLATGAEIHEHGIFVQASAALLLLLFARAVWRNGLRSWLGSLGEAFTGDDAGHGHAHAHVHVHANEHEASAR